MDWKYYTAVILGNITGILIHRLIRWYIEGKRKYHNGYETFGCTEGERKGE